MMSLPRALALALGQLGDPAILRVLVKTALITLAIFAAGGVGLYWAFDTAIGASGSDDRFGLGAVAAAIIALVAGCLLFRVVALFVLQFFGDAVVRAVEQRHYPQAAQTLRPIGLAEETGNALRSLARTLVANALALPLAVLLLASGIGPALVFFGVNAVLLGRELQDMAWLPHRADRSDPAPLSGATRALLGAMTVALLAIPFVNLLAPIVGAATATHLVHRARGKGPHA